MRTWGLSLGQQAEVWYFWRRGHPVRSVALCVGRPETKVWRYLLQYGGHAPVLRHRGATALTAAEREEISRGLVAGESCRRLAARLGRAPSTVSREVARNGGPARYRATRADAAAWKRAERPKPARLAAHPALRDVVERRLAQRWSPEQIAHWLPRAYPGRPDDARVARDDLPTICLSLFVQGRGAARAPGVPAHAPAHAHPARRAGEPGRGRRAHPRHALDPRAAGRRGRSRRPRPLGGGPVSRPARGRSGVGTLVERTSRYVLLEEPLVREHAGWAPEQLRCRASE